MKEPRIERHFVTLECPAGGSRQVHYRRAGSGPPLLLLHPSPQSSEALEPLIRELAHQATVIAPDTPGYGFSDPLPETPQDIVDYARAFKELVDALQLEAAGLYGSATGAQIVIEFCKLFPERTDFVILENVAHFEDAERQNILQHYFLDLQPRADGAHLLAAWHQARYMFEFFPWFDATPQARIAAPLLPEALHAMTMGCLQAGEAYALAYRAAFLNEDFERILPITRPVRIIHREGGLLQRYNRALDTTRWPEHIRVVHCGAEPEQRFAALGAAVGELKDDARQTPAPPALPGQDRYLRSGEAQFHVLSAGPGQGETLLYLHDAGAAAWEWHPLMCEHNPAAECRQLAPDLPGHGLSDRLPDTELSLDALADWLQWLLRELSVGECTVHASGLGAALACEYRRREPQCVQAVHVHGLTPPPWNAELAPDIQTRWDGGHLLQAWSMLNERCLYHPWNQRDAAHRIALTEAMPSPALLTRQLLHLFRARDIYPQALRLGCEHFARDIEALEPGAEATDAMRRGEARAHTTV